ncbi:MAG: acylphosphatase [Phenylobacterium sp.]
MPHTAAKLMVEGRVQGVGYRWWTVERAREFGLSGWVRNRPDRSVEILAIGDEAGIQRLFDACREGPAGAVVRAVRLEAAEDDGSDGFRQKATG